jgi:hypothetical protein
VTVAAQVAEHDHAKVPALGDQGRDQHLPPAFRGLAGAADDLREAGFAVRDLPGQGTVRASVGAWSSEDELARLAELTCS